MGNHDHDSGLEEEQTEIFVNTEYCVTRRCDEDITDIQTITYPF